MCRCFTVHISPHLLPYVVCARLFLCPFIYWLSVTVVWVTKIDEHTWPFNGENKWKMTKNHEYVDSRDTEMASSNITRLLCPGHGFSFLLSKLLRDEVITKSPDWCVRYKLSTSIIHRRRRCDAVWCMKRWLRAFLHTHTPINTRKHKYKGETSLPSLWRGFTIHLEVIFKSKKVHFPGRCAGNGFFPTLTYKWTKKLKLESRKLLIHFEGMACINRWFFGAPTRKLFNCIF